MFDEYKSKNSEIFKSKYLVHNFDTHKMVSNTTHNSYDVLKNELDQSML